MPYNSTFIQRITESTSILLQEAGGKMNYMKLVKLLYFADRKALEEFEHPITYDTYANLPRGPILSSTLNLVKGQFSASAYWDKYFEREDRYIKVRGEYPKLKKLSPADVRILKKIYSDLGQYNQFQLAELSEKLPEWEDPHGSSNPLEIPEILAKLKYSKKDIERIRSELLDKCILDAAFSAR